MENTGLTQEVKFQTNRKLQDVETDLGGIDGVRNVTCDSDGKTVSITFDPTVVDVNLLKQAVDNGTGSTSLLGDLPGGTAQPVSGLDVAYGGADRSPATQGQPPSSTV